MINDLMVLGLVPGTNFQITFSEILLWSDILLVSLLLYMRLAPAISFRKIADQYYYARLYLSVKHGQQLKLHV